jgi:GNAT superfamily N-acetyltransferase
MPEITLKSISEAKDFEDALDLAQRASDYVVLEVGHPPEEGFIRDFFRATPPGLGPDCLLSFAVMEETAMAGMVCIARGYEYPDDWWLGLMLLDPAFRGRGIGRAVMAAIRELAEAENAASIKLAVLCANPRGLKFWLREGFEPHRFAPATPDSDGHDRIVLKHPLRTGARLAAE